MLFAGTFVDRGSKFQIIVTGLNEGSESKNKTANISMF